MSLSFDNLADAQAYISLLYDAVGLFAQVNIQPSHSPSLALNVGDIGAIDERTALFRVTQHVENQYRDPRAPKDYVFCSRGVVMNGLPVYVGGTVALYFGAHWLFTTETGRRCRIYPPTHPSKANKLLPFSSSRTQCSPLSHTTNNPILRVESRLFVVFIEREHTPCCSQRAPLLRALGTTQVLGRVLTLRREYGRRSMGYLTGMLH